MKNNSGNSYEIHTHGQTAFAFENSTAIQTNLVTDAVELHELLEKILAETDTTIAEHRQLRGDVKEILDSLTKTGQIPKESKGWLQAALTKLITDESLKKSTGIITLVSKAVDLCSKVL